MEPEPEPGPEPEPEPGAQPTLGPPLVATTEEVVPPAYARMTPKGARVKLARIYDAHGVTRDVDQTLRDWVAKHGKGTETELIAKVESKYGASVKTPRRELQRPQLPRPGRSMRPALTKARADAETQPDFAPARTFDGARAGFSFRTGPLGTGYYRDRSVTSSSEQKMSQSVRRTEDVTQRDAAAATPIGVVEAADLAETRPAAARHQAQIDEYLQSEEFLALGFSDEVLRPKLAEAKKLIKRLQEQEDDLEYNPCNDSDDRSALRSSIAGLGEDIEKLCLPTKLMSLLGKSC